MTAFIAECLRRVATGARQTDATRAQGVTRLADRWQRQALAEVSWSTPETELLPHGGAFASIK